MLLSIIIPTLNEEKNLKKLLQSLKKQKFKDYEIIISDNNSKDKTKSIAKKFKCRIVKGGLPAKARNNGAKLAKGDYLLFLDADVILPDNFLSKIISEFEEKYFEIASPYIKPLTNKLFIKFYHHIYNIWMYSMQKIDPYAPGFCILIKKSAFKQIKGFDETIKLAEDHALARKAFRNKIRYGILKSSKVLVSIRRFETEGTLRLLMIYLSAMLYRIFISEIRTNIFKYEFKHK
ncbi:MAG: glycosyltransferase [Nanoarchaeota archaeon]|nr:glycosyltransferase [Nanoarchaeota archaeon]MBU0962558.1 glycosyltransferase [Nanoarchaeota archaeon]